MSDTTWITGVLADLIDILDEEQHALTREHLARAAESLEPSATNWPEPTRQARSAHTIVH